MILLATAAAVTGGLNIFGFNIGIPVIIAFIVGYFSGKKWG